MTGISKGRKAAIGFRAHSGWACAMLVAGSRNGIEIIERRRVELCDPKIEGSKQPFHEAEPMPFTKADAFITRCTAATDKLAQAAITSLQDIAEGNDLRIVGACLTTASGRALPDLRGILASHTLIHAAEGEFYRDALGRAVEAAKLKVSRVKEKDAAVWTASRIDLNESRLREELAAIGKTLGPPWTADEKLATMAAWLVLAV
jgi:hypothetical protein